MRVEIQVKKCMYVFTYVSIHDIVKYLVNIYTYIARHH